MWYAHNNQGMRAATRSSLLLLLSFNAFLPSETTAWSPQPPQERGGGFNASATPESYRAAFERARTLLGHLSTEEQNKILGENAVKLLGFGKA